MGMPFLFGCLAFAAGMTAVEAGRFALPAIDAYLNAQGTQNLPYQLAALAAGAALWALFTLIAYRRSAKSFEAFDL